MTIWQRLGQAILFWIVVAIVVVVCLGGGTYLYYHITGHPYYTEFQPYDGNYCLDAKGWPWGTPPGYLYREQVVMPSVFEDADHSGPQRMVSVERINDSAWVPFEKWPSCKEYGEV